MTATGTITIHQLTGSAGAEGGKDGKRRRGLGPVGDTHPEGAPPRAEAPLREVRRVRDGLRGERPPGQAVPRNPRSRAPARPRFLRDTFCGGGGGARRNPPGRPPPGTPPPPPSTTPSTVP